MTMFIIICILLRTLLYRRSKTAAASGKAFKLWNRIDGLENYSEKEKRLKNKQ